MQLPSNFRLQYIYSSKYIVEGNLKRGESRYMLYARPSRAKPSTAQHSTAQHSTAQHSTACLFICFPSRYTVHKFLPPSHGPIHIHIQKHIAIGSLLYYYIIHTVYTYIQGLDWTGLDEYSVIDALWSESEWMRAIQIIYIIYVCVASK